MADKIKEGMIQRGFVLATLDHRRLQVICDNRLWNSPKEVQRVLTGTDKIFLLMALTGFDPFPNHKIS